MHWQRARSMRRWILCRLKQDSSSGGGPLLCQACRHHSVDAAECKGCAAVSLDDSGGFNELGYVKTHS